MRFVLDTNIILVYLRDSNTKEFIEKTYTPFDLSNIPIVSVVTLGEIKSIAVRNNWGQKRITAVERFLKQCVVADINSLDVIEKYGEIDGYSQGKLKHKPLKNTSRNMGKNDLWIAATASVTNATLLTTDKDFTHLNGVYLNLSLISLIR